MACLRFKLWRRFVLQTTKLNYLKENWPLELDLNQRPRALQAHALPPELSSVRNPHRASPIKTKLIRIYFIFSTCEVEDGDVL